MRQFMCFVCPGFGIDQAEVICAYLPPFLGSLILAISKILGSYFSCAEAEQELG
jgi:hypothetical protein